MKRRSGTITFYIFTLVVAIVLLRPTIIFRAHLLQSLNYKSQAGKFGTAETIKKRKEGVRLNNIVCKDVEVVNISNPINFWFKAIKEHLSTISFLLSFLLSLSIFRIRIKSTLSEIVPDNHHYLSLSVIRI
jgi:hypothetical protein